jgi:hypothetical protein
MQKPQIIRRISITLLVLVAFYGCGAHQLRQAQDSYNTAARIEEQLSFEELTPAGDPLEGASQALQNYRVALSLTDEALNRYAKSLKQDQLYGTGLILKALCQWRIAALQEDADKEKIQKIVGEIENRVQQEGIKLGTRDQVLLKALPGLYEHERGLQQHDPKIAARYFESALETLDNALREVKPPEDHPVRAYVHLAQLRTVRAWRWVEYPNRPKQMDQLKQWHDDWIRKYTFYRDKIAPLMDANRGLQSLVKNMDVIFGFQAVSK